MTTRIGFIGTGVMGLPMARNLLRAGFAVTAYNRTASRAEPLREEGAMLAATPREAAAGADFVITMVSDTPDVRSVILGDDGAAAGAAAGSVIIDMSTISPEATREIAALLARQGVGMLDAPVSGGWKGAIEGTLSIMVGGDAVTLERARPILSAMGARITHCGDHGQGQMVKLCNQVAVANNLLAAAEAVVFARKAGVDPAVMLEAVGAGAGGSWAITNLAPRMASHDFAPGFMIKLQQKDLRIVMQAASEMGVALPGTALVHQLLNAAEADGRADEGTQALVTVLERLARLEDSR